MGLAEQIRAGAKLERSTVALTTNSQGSGSINLGATYALLNIQTNTPCRLRLYDNSASLEDIGEASRSFGNLSISSSIALVGDFSMSSAGTVYSIDPIMYGLVESSSNQLSYYRINNATSPPQITITRYLLEDSTLSSVVGSLYPVANRRSFIIQTSSLAANASASGALSGDPTIPQTYLLVSASTSGAGNLVRLRLYSNSTPLYDERERSRTFDIEPSASIPLIVDAFISGNQTTYFVPKIIGANLQNMGTELTALRSDINKRRGENELYYIIENKRHVATPVTTSLHLYSLED